jgi:hypothetical protein
MTFGARIQTNYGNEAKMEKKTRNDNIKITREV